MASDGNLHSPIEPLGDSDYGSDLDDEVWDSAFSQVESQPLLEIAIDDLEDPVILQDAAQPQHGTLRLPLAREDSRQIFGGTHYAVTSSAIESAKIEVEYDITSESRTASIRLEDQGERQREQEPSTEEPDTAPDTRTPLERFRTPPKKPLSVTDIVSPAWCELQYWYSLTRYGRVRRTPAMKRGTKIHKEKEREVHVEVPVEITTPEDRLGLRLWNIIHGLRTLRTTGLTRELEVVGLINGEVIVGIIDEINTACPDEEAEAAILNGDMNTRKSGGKAEAKSKPADQRTMNEYFATSRVNTILENSGPWLGSLQEKPKTYYLVDIKTRQSDRLPPDAQMKPTRIQLMMYRHLLLELASHRVVGDQIFTRYNVDPNQAFSDTFIAALANLDYNSSQESELHGELDPLDEIITHNTLASLWGFMMEEFTKTIPVDNSSSSSSSIISPLLTAEYRKSDTGALIGRKPFPISADELDSHVNGTMQWWRGERRAKGVDVEDAWKCSMCEFAVGCKWRAGKIDEATQKAQLRSEARAKARSIQSTS